MRKIDKHKKGLKFNYIIDDKVFMDKYITIEEFLNTTFPKNNDPLSPKYNTEIFNITWNASSRNIFRNVKTIFDLKNVLSCKDIEIQLELAEYNRKSIHSIESIKSLTEGVLFEKDKRNAKMLLDGDSIKGNSQRFQTFFTKGVRCVCCGIEGKYFAKEKGIRDISYHLNLYALDDDGNEVLMTKDHIIPRSKGGTNTLENYQPMCYICNIKKGNKIYDE